VFDTSNERSASDRRFDGNTLHMVQVNTHIPPEISPRDNHIRVGFPFQRRQDLIQVVIRNIFLTKSRNALVIHYDTDTGPRQFATDPCNDFAEFVRWLAEVGDDDVDGWDG
jgi:hypothetical protein